jgi:sulfate permease
VWEVLLILVSAVFALAMGGSGMAPAFAAVTGARLLGRPAALLLYTLAVIGGAVFMGHFVARTLGTGLVGEGVFDLPRTLCVLAAAATALLLANVLKIPQSTSWVTVFAIAVVGLHTSSLKLEVIVGRFLPAWVALPILAFVLTAALMRVVFPVRPKNHALHELLQRHQGKLKVLAIGSSLYVAAAIGANNVANVVGPLAASGVMGIGTGMWVIAPLFGLGALLFPAPTRTVGRSIVPLGLLTACLCNVVAGTLLFGASRLGIPQSLVQINAATVMAVSWVKEGSYDLMPQQVLRRMGLLWIGTPLLASVLTWALLQMLD